MLQLEDLSKHFGGLPALDAVSFSVPRGAITALIGPNGAGKSTLINCLTGVLPANRGAAFFLGENLVGLPAHTIACRGIARTFQNLKIFPRLSVLDNVLTGLTCEGGRSMVMAMLRLPALRHRERQLKLRALEALDRYSLADKAAWPAGVLAYGDKKRLELARATVSRPALILLDEPVAGLNAAETAAVGEQLQRLKSLFFEPVCRQGVLGVFDGSAARAGQLAELETQLDRLGLHQVLPSTPGNPFWLAVDMPARTTSIKPEP